MTLVASQALLAAERERGQQLARFLPNSDWFRVSEVVGLDHPYQYLTIQPATVSFYKK